MPFQFLPGLGMGLVGVGQAYLRVVPQSQESGFFLMAVQINEALPSLGANPDPESMISPDQVALRLGLQVP